MQKDQAQFLYQMAIDRSSERGPRMVLAVGVSPPQVITLTDRQEKTADSISMKPLCNGV
jgi:hypothetical protein